MNGNSNSSSSNVQNSSENNIASSTTEYIDSLYARRNQDWDSFFDDENNIDNMKNRMELENDINASDYNDDTTPMISLNNSTSELNLSSKPNEAQHSNDDIISDELDESIVLNEISGGAVADKSMDDSSLSYIAGYDLVKGPKSITNDYNDDDTPIVSLNNSTSDLNIASPKPIIMHDQSQCDDDMLDDDSMSHTSRLHHHHHLHHHIVENTQSNELKRNVIDDYNVMENSIGVNDEIIDDDDDEDDILIDKKSLIDPKIDMFMSTPIEQNVIVSSVTQPKQTDDYRVVCDPIDDDYDETSHIKLQPMSQPKREGVLVFNRSSSNLDVSSLSLHGNNSSSMIEDNQNSNHSSSNGNMVDCNKIIDGGDVVVIRGMNDDVDDLNYDENDVQSMDAIERRDYEHEQKLTGGVIVRNCSLITNERLNLDIINSLKKEDTLVKSVNDEDKKTLHSNTITSTPTSSRNSTIRTTKSAVKLNLSASLDRVAAAASSNSNHDIKNESDSSIISSSKKLDLTSKINCKLNPGIVTAIATTSSPSISSPSSSSTTTSSSVLAAKSSIIRNPSSSLVDGNCFMNTNSNDSLSSDEGVKDSINNLNNNNSNNSNQIVKNHLPIIAGCSTASSSSTSSNHNINNSNNNNNSAGGSSSSKIVTNKIICSTSTSSSSSPNCQFSGHHCCADNLDDNDDVEIINNDDDNHEARVSSPNRKFGDYFGDSNEFGSSSGTLARRTPKAIKSIVERNIDEFEHNLQHHHHHHMDAPQMIISVSERDHDFEEDTWADCEEGFDVEEVCTCKNYAEEDERIGCDSEDELPSKDVDLSGFTNIDSTLPDEILQDPNTNDTTPRIHRKRKLTGTIGSETTSGGRKRLALHNSNLSPRKGTTPTTPTTLSGSSPLLFPSPSLSERRTPRSLIPTKDNPPPELNEWLIQFQKWSPAERILAVDRLIESCDPTQVRHMMKVIEPQFQRDFISLLPKEVALQVLSFLEPCDLLRAAQTCRSWRFLCDDNLLWKEKCKQVSIVMEASQDRPKRGRAGNMPPISSEWKAAYMRQHIIEMNWRSRPIREPKILKGHDDHVITCLQFCGNRIVSGSDDNTLKVWSAVTGKCLRTLVGHTGGVWSSQMAGNIIISGSTDRTLKVWNAESGQCIHTLYGHTSTVRCMHLHENKVVSGSRDATLRVWDINTGACLHVLVGHLAAVRCVQYDGRLVVSGAYDYMVKVWNPEKQECLHTLQGHTNRVYSLQFDGIHVVSGSLDTSIRVWDAETGSCKHTLMGHQSLTSGMELRQNILVSGNADSTVKVWDIITGQCLQTLSGSNKHQSAVTCLQFNSRFVITSSDDGTVKLWDVKTGEFIRNLVALDSGGSGGVVWRIRANDTKLVCAVGSRNGTEETKLMVLDFDVEGACLKCS